MKKVIVCFFFSWIIFNHSYKRLTQYLFASHSEILWKFYATTLSLLILNWFISILSFNLRASLPFVVISRLKFRSIISWVIVQQYYTLLAANECQSEASLACALHAVVIFRGAVLPSPQGRIRGIENIWGKIFEMPFFFFFFPISIVFGICIRWHGLDLFGSFSLSRPKFYAEHWTQSPNVHFAVGFPKTLADLISLF